MSRRFVNLMVSKLGGRRPAFNLHRIDPAMLFSPTGSPKPADLAAIKKAPASDMAPARLPPAAISFYQRNGWMDFMALNDDIMAVDHEGRPLLYDGAVGAVRVINPMVSTKCSSISLTVGDYLFVMTRDAGRSHQVHHFQALSFKDWLWHPLKPLKFNEMDYIWHPSFDNYYKLGLEQLDPFEVCSYTVVGNTEIWISTVGVGTYSFDARSGIWSKIGDWALPFSGRAHYVAEHGLWIGFSGDDQLCAADLQQQPPELPLQKFPVLYTWKEPSLPEAWTTTAASLFPLGSGKLCTARSFRATNGEKLLPDCKHEKVESFAVLAGVEAVKHDGTGSLQIIKHNSVCYNLGEAAAKPL